MKDRLLLAFSARIVGVTACLIASMLLAQPRHSAQAQSGLEDVQQTVIASYGESLTFQVSARAPVPLVNAQLQLRILNRNAPIDFPVAISEGASVTVSTAVPVGDIELPPAATLTYFWIFRDANGTEYRSDVAEARYADNRVPWEWTSQEQGNVVVFTDGSDRQTAETVLAIAQSSLDSTGRLLGQTLQGQVLVYVYPSLASMANSLRSHRLTVQDWVAAYAIPDQRTVFVAAPPGADMLANLQQDLSHELTHLAVYAAAGDHAQSIPGWFDEGLAIHALESPDPTLELTLQEAVSNRVLLPIETLCVRNFSSLPPHDAALSYAQSASLVRYVGDRFGTSQLAALMSAYASGLGCSEGVQLALGITLTELESQWIQSLSAQASSEQGERASLMPWLLAWMGSIALALLFISPQPPRVDERPLFDTLRSLPPVPSDEA